MFKLSITVWANLEYTKITIEDKKEILKKILTKKLFIDKFLNNVTLQLHTTTKNIYTDYNHKLQTYTKQLHDFLTNKTTQQDTTFTIDELSSIMTNNVHEQTNHNPHTNTLTDKPTTFTNFYSITRLQKYIKEHYN